MLIPGFFKMNFLLLIACSNRKALEKDSLPAIERYDGGAYRVIRKLKREGTFPQNVDIAILSAKFGLIKSTALIPYYDLQMSKQRASELHSEVRRTLFEFLSIKKYSEVYVDLGSSYLAALQGIKLPPESSLTFAEGRIGERLAKLKVWLTSKR